MVRSLYLGERKGDINQFCENMFDACLKDKSTSQVPLDDQVVNINKPILLDTMTARLGGVDIQNGGRLVFSPGNIISPKLHSFLSQIN